MSVPARTALDAARLLLDALTLDCRAVSKAVDTLEGLARVGQPAPEGDLAVLERIGARYREVGQRVVQRARRTLDTRVGGVS